MPKLLKVSFDLRCFGSNERRTIDSIGNFGLTPRDLFKATRYCEYFICKFKSKENSLPSSISST